MNTDNNATVATAETEKPIKSVKAKVALKPSLGEYLESVLRDCKAQKGQYEATMPPALRDKVRNGKAGLRITSLRDQIPSDDAHGMAYLVSCKVSEAIETALALAVELPTLRAKAKEKAGKVA